MRGLIVVLVLLLAGPSSAATWQPAANRSLAIDRERSNATFAVRLIWWQTIRGRFEDVRGSVHVDPRDGLARIHARIAVGSVRVHPAHYRHRMLAKNFFDAATYPQITYISSPTPIADLRHGGHLHGELAMHGVTRPLSLQIADTRCPETGLAGCVFHLQGWIDRTRFGMNAHRTLVSTRVRLDLVIQLAATITPASPERQIPPHPAHAASTR